VADPWVTGGWYLYNHFSRNETFYIWNGWKLGTPTEAADICGLLALLGVPGIIVGVACYVYIKRVIADINATVYYAVYNYHKRLVIRLTYLQFIYAGSYAEYSLVLRVQT
jgi:hypothetical protein